MFHFCLFFSKVRNKAPPISLGETFVHVFLLICELFDINAHPVDRTTVLQVTLSRKIDCCKVGGQSIVLTLDHQSLLLRFKTPSGQCFASLD